MLLLVRGGWRESRSGGQREKTFFASFKQLFFCFLCVCKKKRKRVDLDEVRDRFKDHTRREEGRIVVWIAQNSEHYPSPM